MMGFFRTFLECRNGGAAAEMALITPVAVLVMFTGFEVGHYMYVEHQVVKGLRDGARYAARQSFDEINCRSGPSIATGVPDRIQNVVRTGQISGGTTRVSGWVNTDITVTVTCPTAAESQTGIYDSGEPAPQVTLSTSIDYNSLFNGIGILDDEATILGSQQATVMGI